MENKVINYRVNYNTQEGDCCPECNANWDGGDILDKFKNMRSDPTEPNYEYYKDYTDEQLLEVVGHYGYTEDEPKRFGLIIGIELSYDHPERYDGTSYWACPECGVAWSRFTGERSEMFINEITNRSDMSD